MLNYCIEKSLGFWANYGELENSFISMRYSFKLLLIALLTLPLSLAVVFLGLFDATGKLVYGIGRFWTGAILKIGGVRLKIHGLEHLDSNRAYIFMANHQSNLDIPVLIQSLPKFQLRWVAKKELVLVPFFGWALFFSRHVLVDRSSRENAMASFKKAGEKIAAGISVVFFPEGTRGAGDKLLPFKRGGFLLAMRTQTPIVPVTINGSGSILSKGDWRIRRGAIEVIVSKPISPERSPEGGLQETVSEVRRIIESHAGPKAAMAFDDANLDLMLGRRGSLSQT